MLLSCKEQNVSSYNPETLITQRSDTLTMIVSQNGRKSYRFETPLLERYELAREPYMEFTQGIFLETFKDSTEEIESTIIADYAIRYENQSRWEARGNVVATGVEGRTLYTQQLFWDEKTERIFSNVTSTVVQGDDVFVGERFISDDKLQNWRFLNYEGQVGFDTSPNEGVQEEGEETLPDVDATEAPIPEPAPAEEAAPVETVPERRPAPAPTPAQRPNERDEKQLQDTRQLIEGAAIQVIDTPVELKENPVR